MKARFLQLFSKRAAYGSNVLNYGTYFLSPTAVAGTGQSRMWLSGPGKGSLATELKVNGCLLGEVGEAVSACLESFDHP